MGHQCRRLGCPHCSPSRQPASSTCSSCAPRPQPSTSYYLLHVRCTAQHGTTLRPCPCCWSQPQHSSTCTAPTRCTGSCSSRTLQRPHPARSAALSARPHHVTSRGTVCTAPRSRPPHHLQLRSHNRKRSRRKHHPVTRTMRQRGTRAVVVPQHRILLQMTLLLLDPPRQAAT